MDRKWMSASRLSKEYEDGVKEFIRFAVEHAENPNKIICPCLNCCYSKQIGVNELLDHLICNGIDQSYTCWTKHGEMRNEYRDHKDNISPTTTGPYINTNDQCDQFEEITNMVEEDLRDCPEMFDRLVSDAEKPLYDGCTKFTRLSAINVKAETIYYLDSMHGDPVNHRDMMDVFNMVLQVFRSQVGMVVPKSKLKSIKWKKIKCPKQHNDVDCGYYVLRFMRDIITCNQMTIPDEYFSEHQCVRYSEEQINDVREEWSRYVASLLGK